MSNLSRRGFLGQISALAGIISSYTFFPFINKTKYANGGYLKRDAKHIPIINSNIITFRDYTGNKFKIGEMIYADSKGNLVPYKKNTNIYPIGVCLQNYENNTLYKIQTNII